MASKSSPILDFEIAKLASAFGVLVSLIGVFLTGPALVILGLLGWLVGVYALSQHYGRREIFDYAIYAGVAGMLAGVVAAVAIVGSLLGGAGVFSFLVGLLVFWIFMIIAARYLKRHVDVLLAESPSDALERAGRYIYMGSFLSIVIVGLLVALVGFVFLVIGLLELKPPRKAAPSPAPPP